MATVLDAASTESAHVFGVSMGGMIAQEFALQYSNLVRSLILGCTAGGVPVPYRPNRKRCKLLCAATSRPKNPRKLLSLSFM
ncbi:MAG TPA: alpha/beta fold hydrolase [Candidatus Acidoferrum sp.]